MGVYMLCAYYTIETKQGLCSLDCYQLILFMMCYNMFNNIMSTNKMALKECFTLNGKSTQWRNKMGVKGTFHPKWEVYIVEKYRHSGETRHN